MALGNPPKILVIKSDTSELNNVEVFVKELFTENNIPRKNFNKVFPISYLKQTNSKIVLQLKFQLHWLRNRKSLCCAKQ